LKKEEVIGFQKRKGRAFTTAKNRRKTPPIQKKTGEREGSNPYPTQGERHLLVRYQGKKGSLLIPPRLRSRKSWLASTRHEGPLLRRARIAYSRMKEGGESTIAKKRGVD